MELKIAPDKTILGAQAAAEGADAIRIAIAVKGACTIIVASGASQFEMLDALVAQAGIDWSKVTVLHLLAFNDPPADFEVEAPYIVVTLDEACRRQQLGEGWFPSLRAVPERAISMSIRQILKSKRIILCVPDARKSQAVEAAVEGEITPDHPASVFRRHGNCTLHLDPPAASLLSRPRAA